MNNYPIPSILTPLLANKDCLLAIGISGGKDSQAMLNYLKHLSTTHNWRCKLLAIHADLGRLEWQQTPQFVEHLCEEAGIELVVVKAKDDLLDGWRNRYYKLKTEKNNSIPFWSSAASRYCTSNYKIAPINKYLRQYQLVINAIGLRSEESTGRSKKPVLKVRNISTSSLFAKYCDLKTKKVRESPLSPEDAWTVWNQKGRKGRFCLDWLPIHDWELEKVWNWCGTSTSEWQRRRKLPDEDALLGWPAHPAYALGNERLSCQFCVLGSQNDLSNGKRYNPELFTELV
ncbi:MAG: phosphoadenosine phosphosulfate reductase family protein, partial [Microcystaceae cyanobacterium]